MMVSWRIDQGDSLSVLKGMPDQSIHCCITSPPYFGLRDYGHDNQIGLEQTPEEFTDNLVEVFREVKRVLRDDGTVWLNLGDSYVSSATGGESSRPSKMTGGRKNQAEAARRPDKTGFGLKPKNLIGIPWRVAFVLQSDGWYLRQDIIWNKVNPMPESVQDRCTKSHEYIFFLSKSNKYFYDSESIKEDAKNWGTRDRSHGKYTSGDVPISGGDHKGLKGKDYEDDPKRNKRSVWTVATKPFKGAHFATFPPDLITPCILASTSEKGCCSKCGTPLKRIVDNIKGHSRDCPKTQAAHIARGGSGRLTGTVGKSGGGRVDGYSVTIGWEYQCDCRDEVSQCVVLDPFSGAGTTGIVATKHGRSYIGIELNPEYVEMSRNRLEKATRQGDLFMGMAKGDIQ